MFPPDEFDVTLEFIVILRAHSLKDPVDVVVFVGPVAIVKEIEGFERFIDFLNNIKNLIGLLFELLIT